MTDKRLREIAVLEVELAMTEAHAKKLSAIAPNSPNPTNFEKENQMATLLEEENDRAEALRRKIRELKDYF
jgi:hypothetical protein